MANKRFTDTGKWEHNWFTELTPVQKVFWAYLCDNCDSVGIWNINFRTASFLIGAEVSFKDIEKIGLGSRLIQISEDKIWVSGFVKFQYKTLNIKNNAHRGMMKNIINSIGNLPLSGDSKTLIETFNRQLIESRSTLGRGSVDPTGKGNGKGLGKGKEERIVKENEDPLSLEFAQYFQNFVLNVMGSFDTGLVTNFHSKAFQAFGSPKGFEEFATQVTNTKKFKEADAAGQFSYFKKALKDELITRGVL